jgi:hypothetical protein
MYRQAKKQLAITASLNRVLSVSPIAGGRGSDVSGVAWTVDAVS